MQEQTCLYLHGEGTTLGVLLILCRSYKHLQNTWCCCKNGCIYEVLQYKQLDLIIVLLLGISEGKGAVFALNIIVRNEHLNVISQGHDCVKGRGGMW